MIDKSLRPFLFCIAWLSVILGFIGAFLPILPTTPFLILAAYLFSKTSPKFHRWLLSLPKFGPVISEWEEKKTIKKSVKTKAIALLSLSMLATLIFVKVAIKVKMILIFIWISVALYIATRKSE